MPYRSAAGMRLRHRRLSANARRRAVAAIDLPKVRERQATARRAGRPHDRRRASPATPSRPPTAPPNGSRAGRASSGYESALARLAARTASWSCSSASRTTARGTKPRSRRSPPRSSESTRRGCRRAARRHRDFAVRIRHVRLAQHDHGGRRGGARLPHACAKRSRRIGAHLLQTEVAVTARGRRGASARRAVSVLPTSPTPPTCARSDCRPGMEPLLEATAHLRARPQHRRHVRLWRPTPCVVAVDPGDRRRRDARLCRLSKTAARWSIR